jgi:3-methyladenine DNA glycosylase AlkD
LMCYLAVHDKTAGDSKFEAFFPYIYDNSNDERNFVKKAVNWSIRQIGKRNARLCKKAIKLAKDIQKKDDAASKWIAADALKELEKYQEEGKIKSIGEK